MKSVAFTLVELLVAVSIIAIVLTISILAIPTITRDIHTASAITVVSRMLRTANTEADTTNTTFGVVFYVSNGRQYAAYIDHKRPVRPEESWRDVYSRYEIVGNIQKFGGTARVAQMNVRNWTEDGIANDDYRNVFPPLGEDDYVFGNFNKNFFTIMFDRHGKRSAPWCPVVIYDPDDDNDGLGDHTLLAVQDAEGHAEGIMADIWVDWLGNRLELGRKWGAVVYDDDILCNSEDKKEYILSGTKLYLNSYGRVVKSDR